MSKFKVGDTVSFKRGADQRFSDHSANYAVERVNGDWIRLVGVHYPIHESSLSLQREYYPDLRISVERDPSGIDLSTPGAKADAGKSRPTLVLRDMANALQAVIKIATDGAAKYSDGGWLQVPRALDRYEDADLRHMLKRFAEGPTDADSGSLHLAHEAWNALAKLELALRAEKAQGS